MKDRTGEIYSFWTVLKLNHISDDKKKRKYWLCKCICGKEKIVLGESLVSGGSKSCGCKMDELRKIRWKNKSPKIIDINIIKDKIKEKYGNLISIDESSYKGLYTKCKFIDLELGDFFNIPKRVIDGRGHPGRAQKKREDTFLKKYGYKTILQHPQIIEKIKKTNLLKYGSERPLKNKKIYEKYRQNNLKKYGVDNPMRSIEIRNKAKETCIKKYGVENPSQNEDIRNKVKETCIKKFGFESPLASPDIYKKVIQTNNKRYGVNYPCQNKDIAIKNARSQCKSVILKHWKTNEDLICIGSYEVKTIKYLNNKNIDFYWQHKVFNMPNGKTYRPDLYLILEDKWIEIKGYFRKDAKEKWDWFHSLNKNSELWDKNKLKELNIF